MISDQERFQILKAVYDLSIKQGRSLGGDELLKFYAETTGGSLSQPKLIQSLKELEAPVQ